MNIGKQIKALRAQKRVTQEELANILGVSFQAVSKWETGTNLPDVEMLPRLAVYFGVSIDELFKLPREEQFLRIENSFLMESSLEEDIFRSYEAFLLEETRGEEKVRALADLAALFNRRAEAAHREASRYAREAFELDPEDEYNAWSMYLEAENGVCGDEWYDNHYEVIRYFKDFLEEHPQNFLALYGLIENLLADGDFEDAETYIAKLETVADSYRAYMPCHYRAVIALGRGQEAEALRLVQTGVDISPNAWQAYCSVGDLLKKLGRYEEAIPWYEKCFSMQKPPRLSDGLHSIAQLQERLGRIDAAIDARERILKCLREEYDTTKGVEVEKQHAEIRRLRKLL